MISPTSAALERKIRDDLKSALKHFKYSYDKVSRIDFTPELELPDLSFASMTTP